MMISHIDYIRVLEKWIPFAIKYIYRIPERPDLECFGTGYNNWGIQTNQKAFAAFAVCAGSPDFDERNSGISRNEILDHSLKIR